MDDVSNSFAANDKYAVIALTRVPVSGDMPTHLSVDEGLWVTKSAPLDLEAHWKEWIGSIRTQQLSRASLWLCIKKPALQPSVLDDENAHLMDYIGRFFQGLLLAMPLMLYEDAIRITGAVVDEQPSIRQLSPLQTVGWTPERPVELIDPAALRTASQLAKVLASFPQGQYLRLCRVLGAFYRGLYENDVRERLHQFCRAIEGLIQASPGSTKKQFKSRTELFVGPRHHGLMDTIFENRSAVEHMNDPVVEGTEEEKMDQFLRLTRVAEDIARYCLLNILLKPSLLTYFETDAALKQFWSLAEADRQTAWGSSLDVRLD